MSMRTHIKRQLSPQYRDVCGRRCYADFALASLAVISVYLRAWSVRLENRLLSLSKAVCTQIMRWLVVLHTWLHTVRENVRSDIGKLIALRLSLPVFQLHNFLFKLAYTLGERRLFLLGFQSHGLNRQQLGIDLVDCGHQLVEISKSMVRLYKVSYYPDTLHETTNRVYCIYYKPPPKRKTICEVLARSLRRVSATVLSLLRSCLSLSLKRDNFDAILQ